MTTSLTTTVSIPTTEFDEFFNRDVHFLMNLGYADAYSKFKTNMNEKQIAKEITLVMKEKLKLAEVPSEIYNRYYSVHFEDELQKGKKTSKKGNRIDIVIEYPSSIPRWEYIIECKILKTKSHSIGSYTGKNGVMRFVNGDYAADYCEAAMIAFIRDKDLDYWGKSLEKKVENSRSQLSLAKSLERQTKSYSFSHEWCSTHRRKNSKNISLFHIFLKCN